MSEILNEREDMMGWPNKRKPESITIKLDKNIVEELRVEARAWGLRLPNLCQEIIQVHVSDRRMVKRLEMDPEHYTARDGEGVTEYE